MLKTKFSKIAGYCGLLAPVFAFVFITLSIYYSPWFSWSENWLSDLAGDIGDTPIWYALGMSSLLFNLGTIIAGFFGLICALGIKNISILDSRLSRLGTSLLILEAFALISIGGFPKTTGVFNEI